MRIDRIFAGPELRFLQFGVGSSRASDHHCVWAELELAAK
jgi:endonuclease/exonuclease/phosphatase family metal-dependent hydrolase